MNRRQKEKERIKFVNTGKFENSKSWQLSLKDFEYPDSSGHIRKVVYIPDANTIFAHEYKGDQKPKPVWFEEGELLVRPSDKNLLRILKIHPHNKMHYNRYDERTKAIEGLNRNDLIKKALKLIDSAEIDKLKATAFAILEDYSFNMDDAVMQERLEEKAFTTPKWLITELTDPNFHTKQMAALSVLKGILKINPTRTAITWPDGKILVSVPPGQDAIRRLGEFLAENTSESKITLQELGEQNKNYRKEKGPDLGEMIEDQISQASDDDKQEPEQAMPDEGLHAGGFEKMTNEELWEAYKTTFAKNVPGPYKNNREWLIKKIAAAPVES